MDMRAILKQREELAFNRCKLVKEHDKKSDKELQAIISANLNWIQAMPVATATYETNAQAAEKMGEMRYCKELLEARERIQKEKKELEIKIAEKKATWKKEEQNRRERSVLNLPASVSYHGQLIAAILENEDNKSLDELSDWSEELSSLGSEKLEKLLTQLVNEGILLLDNKGKYSLLTICTESLYPPHPLNWAMKKLSVKENISDVKNKLKINRITKVINIIQEAGTVVSEDDIRDIIGYVPDEVETLVDLGILQKQSFKHNYSTIDMYYFMMLGEKGKE